MTTPMNSQNTSSDELAKTNNGNSELTDEQLSKRRAALVRSW